MIVRGSGVRGDSVARSVLRVRDEEQAATSETVCKWKYSDDINYVRALLQDEDCNILGVRRRTGRFCGGRDMFEDSRE